MDAKTTSNPKSARLALVSDDEEDNASSEPTVAEADNEDILAAFPDDTEVRVVFYFAINSHYKPLCSIQEIDLARARLSSCAHLGIPRFAAHLKNICLRANFLQTLEEDVFGPLDILEELDLYDNRIKALGPALKNKASLRYILYLTLIEFVSHHCGPAQSSRPLIQSPPSCPRRVAGHPCPSSSLLCSEQDHKDRAPRPSGVISQKSRVGVE